MQAVTEAAKAAIMAVRQKKIPVKYHKTSASSAKNKWPSTKAAHVQLEISR